MPGEVDELKVNRDITDTFKRVRQAGQVRARFVYIQLQRPQTFQGSLRLLIKNLARGASGKY